MAKCSWKKNEHQIGMLTAWLDEIEDVFLAVRGSKTNDNDKDIFEPLHLVEGRQYLLCRVSKKHKDMFSLSHICIERVFLHKKTTRGGFLTAYCGRTYERCAVKY